MEEEVGVLFPRRPGCRESVHDTTVILDLGVFLARRRPPPPSSLPPPLLPAPSALSPWPHPREQRSLLTPRRVDGGLREQGSPLLASPSRRAGTGRSGWWRRSPSCTSPMHCAGLPSLLRLFNVTEGADQQRSRLCRADEPRVRVQPGLLLQTRVARHAAQRLLPWPLMRCAHPQFVREGKCRGCRPAT